MPRETLWFVLSLIWLALLIVGLLLVLTSSLDEIFGAWAAISSHSADLDQAAPVNRLEAALTALIRADRRLDRRQRASVEPQPARRDLLDPKLSPGTYVRFAVLVWSSLLLVALIFIAITC